MARHLPFVGHDVWHSQQTILQLVHNHDQVHSKKYHEEYHDVELFSIARDVDVLLLLLPAQLWGTSWLVATERKPWLHRASGICTRRRWPCLDHVRVMMYSSMHLMCSRVVKCRCGCIKFTRWIHSSVGKAALQGPRTTRRNVLRPTTMLTRKLERNTPYFHVNFVPALTSRLPRAPTADSREQVMVTSFTCT